MSGFLVVFLLAATTRCFSAPVADDSKIAREVISPGHCNYGGHRYKSGEPFKSTDGCNTCGCSESGYVMCTLMACLPIKAHVDTKSVREVISPGYCNYGGHQYKSGQSFKSTDGCNTCGCSENGYVMCTLMACFNPIKEDIKPAREVISPGHCNYGGHQYKSGQSFKSTDGCNTCGCSENGFVFCTEMACFKPIKEDIKPAREVISPGHCNYGGHQYKSGQSFKSTDGCNTCGCSKNGFVFCTEMACFKPIKEETKLAREVISPGHCNYGGHQYKSGQSFKSTDGCNTCGCSENGFILCTKMACFKPVKEDTKSAREVISRGHCNYGGHKYKSGESFKSTDGCNTCGCSENGFVLCTERACLNPIREDIKPAREVISRGHCNYGGHKYKSGESFKSTDECNTCGCSENGFIFCTAMACLTPVLEEDAEQSQALRRCWYKNQWFNKGEMTMSTDGCNQCICDAIDKITPAFMSCTEMACIKQQNQ